MRRAGACPKWPLKGWGWYEDGAPGQQWEAGEHLKGCAALHWKENETEWRRTQEQRDRPGVK